MYARARARRWDRNSCEETDSGLTDFVLPRVSVKVNFDCETLGIRFADGAAQGRLGAFIKALSPPASDCGGLRQGLRLVQVAPSPEACP